MLEIKLRSVEGGTQSKFLDITWRDKRQTSSVKDQTKAEDIFMTKYKNGFRQVCVARGADNRQTARVTERHCWRRARQRTSLPGPVLPPRACCLAPWVCFWFVFVTLICWHRHEERSAHLTLIYLHSSLITWLLLLLLLLLFRILLHLLTTSFTMLLR